MSGFSQSEPKLIVLAEGSDRRVLVAALQAVRNNKVRVLLLGARAQILEVAAAEGALGQGLLMLDPKTAALRPELCARLFALRNHKGVTKVQARVLLENPLMLAALLVEMGLAHGTLGGAVATTAATIRAALQVIGLAPDVARVSSFFLMYLPALGGATPRTLAFADCALSVDPNDRELADIAVRTARSFEAATGQRARVALLSFSTMGSGSGEQVDKVRRATALAQAQAPDVMIAGELQFDTAFVPAVAEQKGVVSDVAGQANVFVFPNLEAGNIGYKIAQRLGGALAIGPILQGLAKPANDLSRGATSEDILAMIEVTARQAKEETPLVPTSIFEGL